MEIHEDRNVVGKNLDSQEEKVKSKFYIQKIHIKVSKIYVQWEILKNFFSVFMISIIIMIIG